MTTPATERSTIGNFLSLSLASIGVVYGDVGTSPLYTLKAVFNGAHALAVNQANVFGILSLIFWTLTVVVAIKYVIFIMRADNQGEGGIMALMALALQHRHNPRQRVWITAIGLFGTALFYGEGFITPAISVLSAVEGLEVAAPGLHEYILPIAIAVLLLLFAIQRLGTAKVGMAFGPIMCVWFVTLAYWGIHSIQATPNILHALHPGYALTFFIQHGWLGFLVLGAVVLAVTGSEALYADIGHFGRNPIRASWFVFVWPALMLNYLGQGALILRTPDAIQNPFYLLTPNWALYPMIGLSTLATVIASQAVISGAFSITRQAMQLGYLPRQKIVHTSAVEIGQIYMPGINTLLLLGVIGLVLSFQSSPALAAAYGIAVTGAMSIDTLLACVVAIDRWKWRPAYALALFGFFISIDLAFFWANMPKLLQGGWLPLVFGIGIFGVMWTWQKGLTVLRGRIKGRAVSLRTFLEQIGDQPPLRVPGTAVFMTARHISLPLSLLQNFLHNKIIHDRVILLTVVIEDVPHVANAERLLIEELENGFYRVSVRYGFMQSPHVPEVLAECQRAGLAIDPSDVSYFLGRETLMPSDDPVLNGWQEKLFISMARHASSPINFFQLPIERVLELGSVVKL